MEPLNNNNSNQAPRVDVPQAIRLKDLPLPVQVTSGIAGLTFATSAAPGAGWAGLGFATEAKQDTAIVELQTLSSLLTDVRNLTSSVNAATSSMSTLFDKSISDLHEVLKIIASPVNTTFSTTFSHTNTVSNFIDVRPSDGTHYLDFLTAGDSVASARGLLVGGNDSAGNFLPLSLSGTNDCILSVVNTLSSVQTSITGLENAVSSLIANGNAFLSQLVNNPATVITPYVLTCTASNTEYSLALPSGTKAFEIQNRNADVVRWALSTGYVSGLVDPYNVIDPSGEYYTPIPVNLTSKTLYAATSSAGDIIRIKAFT